MKKFLAKLYLVVFGLGFIVLTGWLAAEVKDVSFLEGLWDFWSKLFIVIGFIVVFVILPLVALCILDED